MFAVHGICQWLRTFRDAHLAGFADCFADSRERFRQVERALQSPKKLACDRSVLRVTLMGENRSIAFRGGPYWFAKPGRRLAGWGEPHHGSISAQAQIESHRAIGHDQLYGESRLFH
jgi:hypothetical protein